jgi:uncharacterized protein
MPVKELSRTAMPTVRVWPIMASIALLAVTLIVEALSVTLALRFTGQPAPDEFRTIPWIIRYFGHTVVLLATLLCIGILARGRYQEFGFKRPTSMRYVQIALLFGPLFGAVMTAADYWHNLVNGVPPEGHSLSLANIAGTLTFAGFYAPIVEEILFRGLLLTFLVQRMSGRVRFGPFDVHIGGVIVGVLFSLAHLPSFWTDPLSTAVAQQSYAFVWSIMYAYWYEKSESLLPSIVGHCVGDSVEHVLAFLMVWRWS